MATYTSPYAARLQGGNIGNGEWKTFNAGMGTLEDPLNVISSATPGTGTVVLNNVNTPNPQDMGIYWDGRVPRYVGGPGRVPIQIFLSEQYYAVKPTANQDNVYASVLSTDGTNAGLRWGRGFWCGAVTDFAINISAAASWTGTGTGTSVHATGVDVVCLQVFAATAAVGPYRTVNLFSSTDAAGTPDAQTTNLPGAAVPQITDIYPGVGVGIRNAGPVGETWQMTAPTQRYVFYPPLPQ